MSPFLLFFCCVCVCVCMRESDKAEVLHEGVLTPSAVANELGGVGLDPVHSQTNWAGGP
jgi:hypothetical protein